MWSEMLLRGSRWTLPTAELYGLAASLLLGAAVAHRTRRPARFGWITVVTMHGGVEIWAEILLDGKPLGRSIIYRKRVREGLHRVVGCRPGYRSASRDIRIRSGRELRLRLRLQR